MNRAACLVVAATLVSGFDYPIETLSTPLTVGERTAYQGYARSTATDGGFILTWEDARDSTWASKAYATRISASGAVVDLDGLRVSPGAASQWDPAVACVGGQCLIAWQHSNQGIYVRSLAVATGLLGPVTRLRAMSNVPAQPTVASDGAQFLVAYVTGNALRGRIVSPSGSPLGGELTLFDGAPQQPQYPALLFASGAYLLAWVEQPPAAPARVAALALTPSGAPLNAKLTFSDTPRQWYPAVVSNGSVFVVMWEAAGGDIVARRVSAAGTAIDVGDVTVASTPGNVLMWPAASWDGTAYVLARAPSSGGGVEVALLSGTALMPIGGVLRFGSAQPVTHLSISSRGPRSLVSYSLERSPEPTWLGAALVDSASATLTLLDAGVFHQQGPANAVASTPAWTRDGFALGFELAVDRMHTPTLMPLDVYGTRLSAPLYTLTPAREVSPGIALGLTTEVVAATYDGSALALRVRPFSGSPTDVRLDGLDTLTARWPALLTVDGGALAVWSGATALGTGVMYRAYSSSLGALGPDAGRLVPTSDTGWVGLAPSGSGFHVGYMEGRSLRVVRWPGPGSAVAPPPLTLSNTAMYAAMASDGTQSLVAFSFSADDSVAVALVNANGSLGVVQAVMNSTQSLSATNSYSAPSVAFDGNAFLVAWPTAPDDAGMSQLRLRTVFRDGGVGGTRVVTPANADLEEVHVTAGTPGRAMVSWGQFDATALALRLQTRIIANVPLDAPCYGPNECEVGSCSVGVCSLGPFDAGTPDAGTPDAGTPDAGTPDAGTPDAGTLDAGTPDAGTPDAGTPDAGSSVDAGSTVTDAGVGGADAGTPEVERALGVGCGCHEVGGLAPLLALALRRRRRASRPSE